MAPPWQNAVIKGILTADCQLKKKKKLQPSWKEFKNYINYKSKEMKLESLILRLRIKKDKQVSKKVEKNHFMESLGKCSGSQQ